MTSREFTPAISPRRKPHSAASLSISVSVSFAFASAARICLSGHGRGCAFGRLTLGKSAAGLSGLAPVRRKRPKNDVSVFLYAFSVSGFQCWPAIQDTRSPVVTSTGDLPKPMAACVSL